MTNGERKFWKGTTAPLAINVQCRDAQGNPFIGRRDTLMNILTPGETQAAQDMGPMDTPRWFKLNGTAWVVAEQPASWAHCFGTDDQWINAEIEKADRL